MRKHLKAMLERHAGWIVCGEAADGRQAVSMAQDLKPDLIVRDLVMPTLDVFGAAAGIAKLLPAVPIVVYALDVFPPMELAARKLGIRAVVSKSAGETVLVETLERLLVPEPKMFTFEENRSS